MIRPPRWPWVRGHRSVTPANASSRIWAAICIGLILRLVGNWPVRRARPAFARSPHSSVSWGDAPSLHRRGRPGRRPAPGTSRVRNVSMALAAGPHRTPRRPPRAHGQPPSRRGSGDPIDLLDHVAHLRLFALASPRGRQVLRRKPDLQVVAINHESDGPLPCLAAHAVQEFRQLRCLLLHRPPARIALDDHRLIEQEWASSRQTPLPCGTRSPHRTECPGRRVLHRPTILDQSAGYPDPCSG